MQGNSPMRAWAVVLVCALFALTVQTAGAATPAKKPVASADKPAAKSPATTAKRSSKKKKARTSRKRGQMAIDSERAWQIQEALIRDHYLEGKPSGQWDAATQAALRRYQADHGWQSKSVPDSRALIKLGLGPNHDHLLNPESAMTTVPATGKANPSVKARIADPPAGHSAAAPAEGAAPPPQ